MENKSFVGKPLGGFANVYINPGSGPVEGAIYENAEYNIEQFCKDVDSNCVWARGYSDQDEDGRFNFSIWLNGNENNAILVDMPGLPLEEVRYLGREHSQNIWDFPRLYVEGSSWVWKFAIDTARDVLYGVEND